jgi:hypothetical protein
MNEERGTRMVISTRPSQELTVKLAFGEKLESYSKKRARTNISSTLSVSCEN